MTILEQGTGARSRALPPHWQEHAEVAGADDLDAFLCYLGRSTAATLHALSASAEAARSSLREMRAALHAAVDARIEALARRVDEAEKIKAAALERELVAIDTALETARAVAAACSCESGTEDTDVQRHADLARRLNDLSSLLSALPLLPHEPPTIDVCGGTGTLRRIAGCGAVVAPRPVTACDIEVADFPADARPGCVASFRLHLSSPHYAAAPAEEVEAVLAWLAARVRVDAVLDHAPWKLQQQLDGGGAACAFASRLVPSLLHEPTSRSLRVAFSLPADAAALGGARLEVRRIDVVGSGSVSADQPSSGGACCWLAPVASCAAQAEALATLAAAEAGNVRAQGDVAGRLLDGGKGFAVDAPAALAWYLRAAEQGSVASLINAAYCLQRGGGGIEVDAARAVDLYRIAAAGGSAAAQYNMGVCVAEGLGVSRDVPAAVAWYRQGAAGGDADAQFELAKHLAFGLGVARDTGEAVTWWRRAAAQGHALAADALCEGSIPIRPDW